MRSWAAVSAIGRRSVNVRFSPLTEYCRAGNVTLRPEAPRRSQMPNPMSLRPSSGPPVKFNSASASLPTGLPLSFGLIFTVMLSVAIVLIRGYRGSFVTRGARNA